MQTIQIGNITVEVTFKDIKNIHLSVYPPDGKVRIASPLKIDLDTLRVYVISKLGWIKKQQQKFKNQERESPREYLNRESHYYLGKRYLLRVGFHQTPTKVNLKHKTIEIYTRSYADEAKLKIILDSWYRERLKELIPGIIRNWEHKLNIHVDEFAIKRMKTKWGTCNHDAGRIWLNLELAKKPIECIEYIVVHEMAHLIERRHNKRFIAILDKHLPKWRAYKEELNRLPVSHETWKY